MKRYRCTVLGIQTFLNFACFLHANFEKSQISNSISKTFEWLSIKLIFKSYIGAGVLLAIKRKKQGRINVLSGLKILELFGFLI